MGVLAARAGVVSILVEKTAAFASHRRSVMVARRGGCKAGEPVSGVCARLAAPSRVERIVRR